MEPVIEFWVDVGIRGITISIAIFAGVIAWRNYRPKREADQRNAWWERVRWTLELTTTSSSKEAEVTLGWELLPSIMRNAGVKDCRLAQRRLVAAKETLRIIQEKFPKEDIKK